MPTALTYNFRIYEGVRALARIAGVNLPTNKRVIIALRYIYGIGPTNAVQIAQLLHVHGLASAEQRAAWQPAVA